jgi:hypothetical protein
MPIDFPNTPTLNQTYTVGTRTWIWDGTLWNLTSSTSSALGPTGPTGPTGAESTVTGPTGPTGTTGISPTGPRGPSPSVIVSNTTTVSTSITTANTGTLFRNVSPPLAFLASTLYAYPLPLNSTTPVAIGTQFAITSTQPGTKIAFRADAGVTVVSAVVISNNSYFYTRHAHSIITAIKIDTDTWLIAGDCAQ